MIVASALGRFSPGLFFALVCTTIWATSCATTTRSMKTSTPCRGAAFDVDHPDARCLVENPAQTAGVVPPRDALAIRTLPTPAVVRRGQQSTFAIELRNVTKAPLTVEIDDSCMAFLAVARNASTSSLESDCGGLCSRALKKLQVTLEPGGAVKKAVHLEAVQRRYVGEECQEKSLGPLPPGRYTLEITLPWSDPAPSPENPQAAAARTFRGPLIVEP